MSREMGNKAEQEAVDYLEDLGYKILDRNYYSKFGEIDIIAEKDKVLRFVEVKDRSYNAFGGAASAITKSKIEKILKTARQYLFDKNLLNRDWQIDAILIDGDSVRFIENIFIEGLR